MHTHTHILINETTLNKPAKLEMLIQNGQRFFNIKMFLSYLTLIIVERRILLIIQLTIKQFKIILKICTE